MGHYLSEMWAPWHDSKVELEYDSKWRKEISDILENNPITVSDIQIGDNLELYHNFEEKSKHSYPGYSRNPIKNEFHRVMDSIYSGYFDQFKKFKVQMKVEDTRDGKVLINVPIYLTSCKPWFDIRYFEKK